MVQGRHGEYITSEILELPFSDSVHYFGVSSILNGSVKASLKFEQSDKVIAAGLVCRATSNWTFVTFYVFYNPIEQKTLLALAMCYSGTFSPLFASSLKFPLDTNNRLKLNFFSSKITGTLQNSLGEECIVGNIPHIAFPGYVGLMKLYQTKVSAKDFEVSIMKDSFENIEKPIYKFDVFVSHSTADKSTVKKITTHFRNVGIKYWLIRTLCEIKVEQAPAGEANQTWRDHTFDA